MVSFNEQDIERLKSIKEKTKRVKYTERSLELVLDYDLIRSFAKYSGVDLQDTSGADMENASQVILDKIATKYGSGFSHIRPVIHQNIIYLETDLREYSDEVVDFIKTLADTEIVEENGKLVVNLNGEIGKEEKVHEAIEKLEQMIREKEKIEKIIEEQIEKIDFELGQCLTKFLKKTLSKISDEETIMAVIQSVIKKIENNSFMIPKAVLEDIVIPAWNNYTLLPIEK